MNSGCGPILGLPLFVYAFLVGSVGCYIFMGVKSLFFAAVDCLSRMRFNYD
jgi:hypothetical protein